MQTADNETHDFVFKFEAHAATQTKRGKDAPFMYEVRIESAPGGCGGRTYGYNSRPSFRAGL